MVTSWDGHFFGITGGQSRSCWVPTAVTLLWVCLGLQHSFSQPGPSLQQGDAAISVKVEFNDETGTKVSHSFKS